MKNLKIKTGSVTRLLKDTAFSLKEIESQNARIQKTKDDPEKDDHDVRKQEEVLQEYVDGQADEYQRLLKAYDALKEFLVRTPSMPARAVAKTPS